MIRARSAARRLATALVALAPLGLAPACGQEPLVVATIPAPDAGPTPCTVAPGSDGGADGGGEGDGGAGPCPAGQFCETASCGATHGTCQPRPAACDDPASFVCSCDGVTYFNDCVRRSAGAQLSSQGLCVEKAQSCGGSGNDESPCSTGPGTLAVCATVIPAAFASLIALVAPAPYACLASSSLMSTAIGTCWGLPPNAPSTASTKLRTLCQGSPCMDAYEALQGGAGMVFAEATDCPP